MIEPDAAQLKNTFVIRFCRSYRDREPCWRGRIEHVQSGKCLSFYDPSDMLEFIYSFIIDLEVKAQVETRRRAITDN